MSSGRAKSFARGRVGDRVVNVEKIERFGVSDLRHFYGQRQRVVGAGKNGRVTDLHLMKMDSGQGEIEPDRFGVAEEMDFVAARGQLRAERRRENATAADERKTGDPDLERARFHYSPIYARPESDISSRSTKTTPGASASFRYSRSLAPAT